MQKIDTAGSKQTFVPTKKTLIFLLLAAVPSLLGAAAVSSVLPLISEAFPDVPESIISLIVTLPPLATALAGFFTGALADKIGPKKVLVCGITLFSLAGGRPSL
ncbi:MAG TPA: MFS transporter [Methanocorpusculum sp.]|nr:MFS transporter [Methanocorpusculum sp.]HJJ60297.1 MFS transporter [Methanocorpusculum sp.]